VIRRPAFSFTLSLSSTSSVYRESGSLGYLYFREKSIHRNVQTFTHRGISRGDQSLVWVAAAAMSRVMSRLCAADRVVWQKSFFLTSGG